MFANDIEKGWNFSLQIARERTSEKTLEFKKKMYFNFKHLMLSFGISLFTKMNQLIFWLKRLLSP